MISVWNCELLLYPPVDGRNLNSGASGGGGSGGDCIWKLLSSVNPKVQHTPSCFDFFGAKDTYK